MQPVQECLCRAVLFQGFVVTSILDAYHVSLLLERIIVMTQGRFLWRLYHAPSTEMKSLTCINSKILVDSVFTHLDFAVITIDIISYLVVKNVILRFRPCWVYPVG